MAPVESSSLTVPRRRLGAVAERHADCNVVSLRGDYDASTAAALSQNLARAIAHDESDLVMDLSAVEFMDAATIGVIIRADEFLRQRSRRLIVRSPSRCARRVLDVCGIADLIDTRTNDAARATRNLHALSTWVAVPATDRVDPGFAAASVASRAGP